MCKGIQGHKAGAWHGNKAQGRPHYPLRVQSVLNWQAKAKVGRKA